MAPLLRGQTDERRVGRFRVRHRRRGQLLTFDSLEETVAEFVVRELDFRTQVDDRARCRSRLRRAWLGALASVPASPRVIATSVCSRGRRYSRGD